MRTRICVFVLGSLASAGTGISACSSSSGPSNGRPSTAPDASLDARTGDAGAKLDAGQDGTRHVGHEAGEDAADHDASEQADGSDASKASDTGATTRSAGCGTTPPETASFTGTTTDGDGKTRTFDVLLPSPYDKSTPLALTFAFHGAGATSSTAEGFGIQDGTGAAAASIFVFPQGIDFETYGVGWDDTCSGYDMPFFDNMVSDIESHYCVDTTRLFVAGFSWGCDFVTALKCCRGDRLRAVSAASCTDEYGNPDDYKTYNNLPCPTAANTPIRFTHDASGGDSAYPKPLFTTTSELYESFNGCPTSSGTLPPNVCTTHSSCASEFIECPYTDLGHATPSGWGAATWQFFSTFH